MVRLFGHCYFFLLFHYVSALSDISSSLGPVINLGYAAYVGNSTTPTGESNGPITFFGGIAYAQPPVGDLRFRAPKPLSEGIPINNTVPIVDARDWGPPCIQSPAEVGIGSENCLYLNIWKPSTAKAGDNLPVIVYIHGGGMIYGTPAGFPLFDWVEQSERPIVGVSIAYRLNLLGFLAGDSLDPEDKNAGLQDQRLALEWVQRHITQFGGDPEQVTIAGESAGGASVVMHMVAFGGTKPALFKRVIAQSIGYGPMATDEQANNAFGAISSAINRAGPFSPVVDGPNGFFPALPGTLFASGNFSTVEFIGGHCTNDGRTFVGGDPSDFVTDADVIERVFARFSTLTNATIERALSLYPEPGAPGSPFTSQYDRASTMAQELIFGCMDWFIADQLQKRGVRDIFTYRFNSPNPVLLSQNPFQGVMHTSDLFYLFSGNTRQPNAGFTFTPFNQTEAALSKESVAFWTSFISSGNPSTHRLPSSSAWPPFQSNTRIVLTQAKEANLSISTASGEEVTPRDEIQRCMFWMNVNITQQTRI